MSSKNKGLYLVSVQVLLSPKEYDKIRTDTARYNGGYVFNWLRVRLGLPQNPSGLAKNIPVVSESEYMAKSWITND